MMSLQEQLDVVWVVSLNLDTDDEGIGGAFCFDKKGLLFTAYHVVEGCTPSSTNIQVRSENTRFREARFVVGWKSLDVAILSIVPKEDNNVSETFSFVFPEDDRIQLEVGETVVTHGHGGCLPYSSRTGKLSFPYLSPHNLSTLLSDMSLTINSLTSARLDQIKFNFSRMTYRLVSSVFNKVDVDVAHLHPYLPLIEHDEGCMGGFSGCPLFRLGDGKLVGMILLGDEITYSAPVDVLRYVLSLEIDCNELWDNGNQVITKVWECMHGNVWWSRR